MARPLIATEGGWQPVRVLRITLDEVDMLGLCDVADLMSQVGYPEDEITTASVLRYAVEFTADAFQRLMRAEHDQETQG